MSKRHRIQQLLGLSAFAIAGPILTLLGEAGGFFVAHGLVGHDVALLMLALVVLPGLLLWLVELAVSVAHSRASELVHLCFLALLVGLSGLAMGVRLAPESNVLVVVASVAGMGLFGFACVRAPRFRSGLSILWIAPILFCLAFLVQPDIRTLLVADASAASPSSDAPGAETRGLVVMVIFDELPLTSLLGPDGEIDRIRHPGFARLADTSTWVRGVSAVSSRTQEALPAILTGQYPSADRPLPIRSLHPHNLFTLLAPSHALNIVETSTLLRPSTSPTTRSTNVSPSPSPASACLLEDLALVYAHLISPAALRRTLPPITREWSCLLEATRPDEQSVRPDPVAAASEKKVWLQQQRLEKRKAADRPEVFRRFSRSITPIHQERDPAKGSLHFLHITFPHTPWQYTAGGLRYSDPRLYEIQQARWPAEPWWAIEAQQRHLLQVGFADRLLLELLDSMEAAGLFEEALVVITSDHGTSFWPGEQRRSVEGHPHAEDILSVPLFIKRPHQQQGERLDHAAESIDIVPSIAELLGLDLPIGVDGCSVFSRECARRRERRVLVGDGSGHRVTLTFPVDVVFRTESLERQLALFGSGSRSPAMYQLGGPWSGLVQRLVVQLLRTSEPGGSIALSRQSRAGPRIKGELELERSCGEPEWIAIAVDDRIETVVQAPTTRGGERLVLAMLPDDAVDSGPARIAFYQICEEPRGSAVESGAVERLARLTPIEIR